MVAINLISFPFFISFPFRETQLTRKGGFHPFIEPWGLVREVSPTIAGVQEEETKHLEDGS